MPTSAEWCSPRARAPVTACRRCSPAAGNGWRGAVSALADGGCDDVVVVLGAAIVDVPAPARPVVASDWAEGMGASLRAGISALESGAAEYAVLLTVDTPDIGADAVRRVLDRRPRRALRHRPGRLRSATRSPRRRRAQRTGRSWSHAAHGDEGARSFLAARDDVAWVDCADLATGADIDVNPER